MSDRSGRKVSTQIPDSWIPVDDEEYQRWRSSMRCEGHGKTADWYRYLIRLGLEAAKEQR
jgi:hypothetical protein